MALKLKSSEWRWIVILVLVLAGSWYTKNYYLPRSHKIQAMQSTLRAANARVEKTRKEASDLSDKAGTLEKEITTLKEDSAALDQKLSLIKSNIPSKNALDRLLHAFISPKVGVDIESIKPLEEDHEQYNAHQDKTRETDDSKK